MNDAEIQERMKKSLDIAKGAWEKSILPDVCVNNEKEIGTVALAILAVKIFDALPKSKKSKKK